MLPATSGVAGEEGGDAGGEGRGLGGVLLEGGTVGEGLAGLGVEIHRRRRGGGGRGEEVLLGALRAATQHIQLVASAVGHRR